MIVLFNIAPATLQDIASLIVIIGVISTAYSLKLTRATLSYGRILAAIDPSDSDHNITGILDAIRPPWSTIFSVSAYTLLVAVSIGVGYQEHWILGVLALALAVFVSNLITEVMPDVNGGHYTRVIQHSMLKRYANYVRDGDTTRATAMASLIGKTGINPDDVTDKLI